MMKVNTEIQLNSFKSSFIPLTIRFRLRLCYIRFYWKVWLYEPRPSTTKYTRHSHIIFARQSFEISELWPFSHIILYIRFIIRVIAIFILFVYSSNTYHSQFYSFIFRFKIICAMLQSPNLSLRTHPICAENLEITQTWNNTKYPSEYPTLLLFRTIPFSIYWRKNSFPWYLFLLFVHKFNCSSTWSLDARAAQLKSRPLYISLV